MKLLFLYKLKITYLSNQEHSSNTFVLSATQSSISSNSYLECFIRSKPPQVPQASPLLTLILQTYSKRPKPLAPGCKVSFPIANTDKALWLLPCVETQLEGWAAAKNNEKRRKNDRQVRAWSGSQLNAFHSDRNGRNPTHFEEKSVRVNGFQYGQSQTVLYHLPIQPASPRRGQIHNQRAMNTLRESLDYSRVEGTISRETNPSSHKELRQAQVIAAGSKEARNPVLSSSPCSQAHPGVSQHSLSEGRNWLWTLNFFMAPCSLQ